MAKKSAAQIRRMQARAEARGENYELPDGWTPPEPEAPSEAELAAMSSKDRRNAKRKMTALGQVPRVVKKKKKSEKTMMVEAEEAEEVQPQVKPLYTEEELDKMSSKERRSAKRKMEALVAESKGVDVAVFREEKKEMEEKEEAKVKAASEVKESETVEEDKGDDRKKVNPYIVFVGQLNFKTTEKDLSEHVKKNVSKEVAKTVKIRILTDKESKKSKGMGFIETTTPENLFELLALHHTNLDGRRINVERSAGKGGGKEKRQDKIKSFRKEQKEKMVETVEKVFKEYQERGEIKEGELDDLVKEVCSRHSVVVVDQSLKEYVEMRGDGLENPSAYLNSIVSRVASEGVDRSEMERQKMRRLEKEGKGGRRGGQIGKKGKAEERKEGREGDKDNDGVDMVSKFSSLAGEGVAMNDIKLTNPATGGGDFLNKVFSRSRGRGR
ncbi:hypothetical protein TrLO_g2386 [Triparma laevis f. longispina]|uniref:RRM domain-containing protein n=1 Tax=Triparma laevis f. longispina TaxID=1714387 RepID=A0A9W7FQC0_9STRA|nr:hypothetical protein TrLO_g2386 [Triparma laevis f. longispina]